MISQIDATCGGNWSNRRKSLEPHVTGNVLSIHESNTMIKKKD